jgi:hypothetical protein
MVKLSLFWINWAPRHEHVWGSGGIAPPVLTSALDRGEWLVSRVGRYIPGKDPGTHWTEGWVGPRSGLDVTAKRKNFPLPRIEPRSSSP